MTNTTACHFATMAATREGRPFTYWPSRVSGQLPTFSLNLAAYTGLTLGGHTQ